jgi:hypothetical protein
VVAAPRPAVFATAATPPSRRPGGATVAVVLAMSFGLAQALFV